MTNLVPQKLRHASLLLEGDKDCNVLDLALSIMGANIVASSLPAVRFLTDTPTEGADLVNRLSGWLANHYADRGDNGRVFELKKKTLGYRYNVMNAQPYKLARALIETIPVGDPTWIVRDDSTQTQTGLLGQWPPYANEILKMIRATVIHIVKRDAMRTLPCDPADYQVHWSARDYLIPGRERLGNAVVLKDMATGAQTIWRDRAQSGGASIWYPALDEEIAA